MKKTSILLLLLALLLTGCQSLLLTIIGVTKGFDEAPKHGILLKGEKRVAVVPRTVNSSAYELQNAPREIARHVNNILDEKVQNKKLRVVEQAKVESWLDDCDNNFASFAEVGRDKSIQADIVIGFDIRGFQIRDPKNAHLIQGKCEVLVQVIESTSGKVLVTENLMIIDPPNEMPGNPMVELQFRPQFVRLVAREIASLFHHHQPNRNKRMDADSIDLHRLN